MKRITDHGRLAAFNIGAILGIFLSMAILTCNTPRPINASYNPTKYTHDEVYTAFQTCIDNFYSKDLQLSIATEIVDQMCKDFARRPIPCAYTDVEAGEYKWRWLDKCTVQQLKKLNR